MLELTSEIQDTYLHFDFEDCNNYLKYKYFNGFTVQPQVPIVLHCVISVDKLNEHL